MGLEGTVGSARAVIPLMTVQLVDMGELLRSCLAYTVVVVVKVALTEVAVTVAPTLVTVLVCNVTETVMVVVTEVEFMTAVLQPRIEEQKGCAEFEGHRTSLRACYTAARWLGVSGSVELLCPKLYSIR